MKEFVIDLFCGAGGTSTGVHLANCDSTVTACVNHDLKAIQSHQANHPEAKHFVEDIRNPEVVFFLKLRNNALRKKYPGCIITIWASLECTNFSKAKGGLPRDADSRTLAEHLYMYVEGLKPDYLMIENVVEFMAWGPLCKKGKPVSMRRGLDYLKWIQKIQSFGYRYQYRVLNAADYGAYTSRSRYFAQFAKGELPIAWPAQTHTKNPDKEPGLFGEPLKKWRAVKDVLQLKSEGKSIFARKKPLVENTLKRIYAGLVKFVAEGDDSFILKYNSRNKNGKHIPPDINEPSPTVTTQGRLGIINANFLQSYYGNGNSHSTEEPCPTVSTKDRFGKVSIKFIDHQFGKSKPSSIDQPLGTITQNPKYATVTTEPWIMYISFKNTGKSIQESAPTVLASRRHHYIINTCHKINGNSIAIPIYEDDCKTMVKIKLFMANFGIIDIKMRMLFVEELLRIQGFPEGYTLVGTKTDKKKFIGNSVEVTVAKKIFEAHYNSLKNINIIKKYIK